MKKVLLVTLVLLLALTAQAQDNAPMQHGGHFDITFWFAILEIPFLLICIYYSFKTAQILKGGILGIGMTFLAWGFLVMGIGHVIMQLKHFFNYDLLQVLFGYNGGAIAWFIALSTTWGLSAFGFYKMYSVGKLNK